MTHLDIRYVMYIIHRELCTCALFRGVLKKQNRESAEGCSK